MPAVEVDPVVGQGDANDGAAGVNVDDDEQSDHEQKLFERCKRHFESPDINKAVFVVKSMKEIHAQLQKRVDKYSKDILCMWYGNFLRNGKDDVIARVSHRLRFSCNHLSEKSRPSFFPN